MNDPHEENAKKFFAVDPTGKDTDHTSVIMVHADLDAKLAELLKKSKGFEVKPLVFMDLDWKPDSNFQSRNRIMRTLHVKQKPRIIRSGRYYIRWDMVGIDLPQSFKFRTKRAALKYWWRSPLILRSAKQINATSDYKHLRILGTQTGRISSRDPVMEARQFAADYSNSIANELNIFDEVKGGVKRGELIVHVAKARTGKSKFTMNMDFSDMRIKDPDEF